MRRKGGAPRKLREAESYKSSVILIDKVGTEEEETR